MKIKNTMRLKLNKRGKNPLVSVVIPVFNGADYLQETVQTVLNSSYKNIEVLLIDDGSKDQSNALCRMLATKYRKVKFYSFEKNNGLGRVLNYALQKAKGYYICRINQDDRMLPKRIHAQVMFLHKHQKVVAVGSNIRIFDNKGNTEIIRYPKTDEEIKRVWLIVSPFSDPSVMYRKEAAILVGGYKQEYWPADDTHLWIRMGTIGKLANINKVFVDVRYHDNAASIKYFRKLALITFKMHRWMHENIENASLPIRLFWEVEYLAGITLSPQVNWHIYRILKQILYCGDIALDFLRRIRPKMNITVAKVIPQPIMLSRSGQ